MKIRVVCLYRVEGWRRRRGRTWRAVRVPRRIWSGCLRVVKGAFPNKTDRMTWHLVLKLSMHLSVSLSVCWVMWVCQPSVIIHSVSHTHWPGPLSPVSCLWHSYWTRLWLMLKLELNWVSQTVFGSSWHETKGPPRRTLNLVPESKQICFDAGAHMHRYMDMYTKAGLTC